MRTTCEFKIYNPAEWRKKALLWANEQLYCAYTNPNGLNFPYEPFQEILAAGAIEIYKPTGNEDFEQVFNFHKKNNDWLFGYFGYDLKNQIEKLPQTFPRRKETHQDIFFFQPKHLLFFQGDKVVIESVEPAEQIFNEIEAYKIKLEKLPDIGFTPIMSRDKYLERAGKIREHIIEGDIYELNLCMEFYASEVHIDPVSAYLNLIELSPTPFSGFLRNARNYLICASPERFLKKTGNNLLSQPIKGTAKRSPNPVHDEELKSNLYNSEKERAENMMIVDLVRNDLARSSKPGSVNVEEIFGIYTFRQWHQMISTVSARANEGINWSQIIKNAFPMGSMTGAPKIKVMELIDRYENSRRGVYSGAFGYITPRGDFDFNVIIRSLLYDSVENLLSFHVGSAITYDSIPEEEYNECLLKASAIFSIFWQNKHVK